MHLFIISTLFAVPIVYGNDISDFRCGDWQLLGGQKCYKVLEGPAVSEAEAVAACVGADEPPPEASKAGKGVVDEDTDTPAIYQSTLLTIKSRTQHDYVLDYLRNVVKLKGQVWLGAGRNSGSGRFEWSDGTGILYNRWAENRPSNEGKADCVQLDPKSGNWTDVRCDRTARVVCERTQFWTFPDLQRSYFDLRQVLEFRADELTDQLGAHEEVLRALDDRLYTLDERVKSLKSQLDQFRTDFGGYVNESLSRVVANHQTLATQVNTIGQTADRLGEAVYQLHKECSEGCSGGGGGGDLEALRRELLAEIESRYSQLDTDLKGVVADAQITRTRQLQIKQNNKWKTLGYVH
ncbi:unnamed protein product [Medioppia subpectinata]|uniref:C-type lectin domain-containing protein n=1 Tax=Medioppia subpectinata TaxID=1979941 RepID=A0A7R9L2U5_9ACAR|nr:unnamed protein product [Medioppia subpectinata]CAG2114538.1 unnamed protein product [Medioppia subpectinata]